MLNTFSIVQGFPGGASGKNLAYQCRCCKRCRFDICVRKIPQRKKWQPTPLFLPGESHGQRSLVGYSPLGHKESDTTAETQHGYTLCILEARKFDSFFNEVSVVLKKKCSDECLFPKVLPVNQPRESQGWGSLVGCPLWGRTELDTTEATQQQQQQTST